MCKSFMVRSFSTVMAVLLTVMMGPVPAIAAFVRPEKSQEAMVVSAHPLATAAGVAILRRGGNAVDAAVATAFAISVVEPFSAGLGGGGFALIHHGTLPPKHHLQRELDPSDSGGATSALASSNVPSTVTALDFRERAPGAASRDMYRSATGDVDNNRSRLGHLAVGVPGTVAGLKAMHDRYGNLNWSQVLQPSIVMAAQGIPVSDRLQHAIRSSQDSLSQNPAAADIFLVAGQPPDVGHILKQADLARTLRQISQEADSFYRGDIAGAIAKDMAANDGLVTRSDLETYRPIWRDPICGPFRVKTPAETASDTYDVCSMPPPSSGGVHLLQMLNLLGTADLKTKGWHHPDSLHLLAEVMKIAYADRAEHLGDPDFVAVPVAALVNPAYAEARRSEIEPQRARSPQEVKAADGKMLERYGQLKESQDTTHLTVVDGDRNAVSLTFTINGRFGAGVVAAGTGIVLNNEMDDFAIAPGVPNLYGLVGGEANAVAPGKTPLSSMTPTIVLQDGQFRLAVGAPGGSTIITTVLQALLNVLVYDLDAGAAIAAPRLHHQWLPETLRLERWGFDQLTLDDLESRGHKLEQQTGWGNGNLIQATPDGTLEGAADPRGEGTAQGF